MCGIVGEYRWDGKPVARERLSRAVAALTHRGPDSEGFLIDQDFGMGIRRLRVIDLETGDQPIFNEDGSIGVILNGEIYNFQTLREELTQKGHRFKTRTDTEVIVHAFEEKQTSCLESFSGMFAFALWNQKDRSLFLARDRFGIKPLYYVKLPHAFYFASEIKALLKVPEVSKEIHVDSVAQYLTLGYVPTPDTIFRSIQKLPPGHFILISKTGFHMDSFWKLREQTAPALREEVYLEILQNLIEESVKSHLTSDVPLGVFLSGGTDSSALVAFAHKLARGRLKTFSIGFPDEVSYNELPFARTVAERFQTEHHEYEVRPNAIEVLPKLLHHLEEPFADPSLIPTYYLCQMARREVTVALAGDGGDEIFAGYNRYFWDGWAERYRQFPHWLRRGVLNPLVSLFPEGDQKGWVNVFRRIKKFVRTADLDRTERYTRWFALMENGVLEQVLNGSPSKNRAVDVFGQYFEESRAKDPLRQMQYVDIHTMLLDGLLLKGDKISMAHSLELRVPFLDHHLVDFSYNLPSAMKLNGGKKKYLLKKILYSYFPKTFVDRPKRGFEVPIGRWFRGKLRPFVQELLSVSQIKKRGLFNAEAVHAKILNPHLTGREDHGLALFSLVMLEIWCQEFLEG